MEGSGPSGTLGRLGSVDALGGAFTVALAAAITITVIVRLGIPVSTSQTIVGAIIGWNFFSGRLTDYGSLITICVVLGAGFCAFGCDCRFTLLHGQTLGKSLKTASVGAGSHNPLCFDCSRSFWRLLPGGKQHRQCRRSLCAGFSFQRYQCGKSIYYHWIATTLPDGCTIDRGGHLHLFSQGNAHCRQRPLSFISDHRPGCSVGRGSGAFSICFRGLYNYC